MKDSLQFARVSCCGALVALLAISGYMGAVQLHEQAATVSVPIVFEQLEDTAWISQGEEDRSRLSQEREKALLLLEDVIRDPKASQTAVQEALARKTEIAAYIETEARIMQTLETMGYSDTAALCGGKMTTVVVPREVALDEKARIQIVDAAANAARQSADHIKIILAKNE